MSKTVLVTGGGRGIGIGIVDCCAGESWNVAFCGRTPAHEYDTRCRELQERFSIQAKYYQYDVAKWSGREQLLEQILDDFGSLHALVNNAGVAPLVRTDMLDMTEESYNRVMGINLTGPFFLSQTIANYMVEQKQKNTAFEAMLINIGSISATAVSVNRAEYCMSKAAFGMMNSLFAVRLADFGIPVFELRPGIIHSNMTEGVTEKYDKLIAEGLTLQRRWGEPEDVGKAVVMLLRGDLPYSTGQIIGISGGMDICRL